MFGAARHHSVVVAGAAAALGLGVALMPGAYAASRTPATVGSTPQVVCCGGGGIGVATYQYADGFDTCQQLTSADLQDWWTSTPWWTYGTYLGGSNGSYVGCVPISSSAIAEAVNLGFGLEPFWYGPQLPSPCAMRSWSTTISLNTSTAYAQGVTSAEHARAAANNFGYGAADIIYYDLEAFYNNSGCIAAAQAFIKGWDHELSNPGLYGSSCASYLSSYTGSPVPAAIAPADPNDQADVYNLACLANNVWDVNQRIHQFTNPIYLTYNGYGMYVDEDCADGPVDSNSGNQTINNCAYISSG